MIQAIRDMINKAKKAMEDGEYASNILSDMTVTIEEIQDRIRYREEHPPLHEYVRSLSGEEIPTNSDLVHGPLSGLRVYTNGTKCASISYDSAVRLVDRIEGDSNDSGPFCAICDYEDNTVYSIVIYDDKDEDTIIMVGKNTVIPDGLDIHPRVLDGINKWLQGYD